MNWGPPSRHSRNEQTDAPQPRQIILFSATHGTMGRHVCYHHDLVHIEVMVQGSLGNEAAFCNRLHNLVPASAAITQVKMKQSYAGFPTRLSNMETSLSSTIGYTCSKNNISTRRIQQEPHAESPQGSSMDQCHKSRGVL